MSIHQWTLFQPINLQKKFQTRNICGLWNMASTRKKKQHLGHARVCDNNLSGDATITIHFHENQKISAYVISKPWTLTKLSYYIYNVKRKITCWLSVVGTFKHSSPVLECFKVLLFVTSRSPKWTSFTY